LGGKAEARCAASAQASFPARRAREGKGEKRKVTGGSNQRQQEGATRFPESRAGGSRTAQEKWFDETTGALLAVRSGSGRRAVSNCKLIHQGWSKVLSRGLSRTGIKGVVSGLGVVEGESRRGKVLGQSP